MKKIELIPGSRATRIGTNKTSSSGDENGAIDALRDAQKMCAVTKVGTVLKLRWLHIVLY